MCLRPETVCLCRFSMASDLSFERFNLTCLHRFPWPTNEAGVISLTLGYIDIDRNMPESCAAGTRTKSLVLRKR